MIFILEIIFTLGFLYAGKALQDFLTTFDDDLELFSNDNPSLGIAKAGYYLSIAIALKALFLGSGSGDWYELRDFLIYGSLTLLLLNIATATTDRFVLKSYTLYDEICGKRNDAISWSLFGCYIGSAFILQGAMSGDDMPLGQSIFEVTMYFLIGQLALSLGAWGFGKINPEHDAALGQGNTAAGLSFAGFIAALGLCIGGLSRGNLHMNINDILFFGVASILCIAVLILMRKCLFRYLFANGTSLHREIYEDQNSAAGWIVGFGSLGLAQLIIGALLEYTLT